MQALLFKKRPKMRELVSTFCLTDTENTKRQNKKRRFSYVFKTYDISCLINSFAKSNSLFWYYIKQIMNVFIRAMARIFSFSEKWKVLFNSTIASLNKTFHLSPHENILIIALINIHYLYIIYVGQGSCKDKVLHLHVCIVFCQVHQ